MDRLERGILNPVFAGIVSEITASQLGLAHEEIFVPVQFDSKKTGRGYYRKYDLADSLRLLDVNSLRRRPGGEAPTVARDRITESFVVGRYHLSAIVPNDEAALMAEQSNGAEDLHVTEVRWVRELMLLAEEKQAADLITGPNSPVPTATLTTSWRDTNSDPIKDILDATVTVRNRSALTPNALAISYPVAVALAEHPKVQGRRGLAERQALTKDALAELLKDILGLKKVVVIGAMYVPSRAEGDPVSLTEVWGPGFTLLWYEGNTPGLMEPTFAIKAEDTSYYEGARLGVLDIPRPEREAIEHRVRHDYAFLFVQPEAGLRILGTI